MSRQRVWGTMAQGPEHEFVVAIDSDEGDETVVRLEIKHQRTRQLLKTDLHPIEASKLADALDKALAALDERRRG